MSRSKRNKGAKSPGYEYWSKRPGTKKAGGPGKFAKKLNTRLERIEDKKLEVSELEPCPTCNELAELDGNHYCDGCSNYACECECEEW